MTDTKNNIDATCCICGKGLSLDKAINIALSFPDSPEEIQGLYSHFNCIDKVLHKSVPRHPDLTTEE